VPNCLMLDVGLPDVNGLELHKHVASNRRETPVIVTTGCADVPMSLQAMKAGAFDFLTKHSATRRCGRESGMLSSAVGARRRLD
jgi:FixJ family two-component response regulator